jgi:hypothetical protein
VEPDNSSRIRKQLDTVISPKSKLTKAFKKSQPRWVEPEFFADVEYRDIISLRRRWSGPRGDSTALVGMTLLLNNYTALLPTATFIPPNRWRPKRRKFCHPTVRW